jgi:Domain of unknown function (DUF1707)
MTPTPETPRVRASDAEREQVVTAVQKAGADGRLTLEEVEERLTSVYSTKFRDELAQYTNDLPSERQQAGRPLMTRRPTGPLAVHAAIVAVLAVVLIVRWVASGVGFFWPGFPMFWLAMSLVIHARMRGVIGGGWQGRRWSAR